MNESTRGLDHSHFSTPGVEQRAHQRWDASLPAMVMVDGHSVPGMVTSLSEGGLFLQCASQALEGMLITVHIDPSDAQQPGTILIDARVVHRCEAGMGAEFTGQSHVDRRQITALLVEINRAVSR